MKLSSIFIEVTRATPIMEELPEGGMKARYVDGEKIVLDMAGATISPYEDGGSYILREDGISRKNAHVRETPQEIHELIRKEQRLIHGCER